DSIGTIAVGILLAAAGLVFGIYCAIDAARLSRRARQVVPTRLSRRWVYAAVIGLFIAAGAATHFLDGWATYSIPSGSMIPALRPGDYIIAWRDYRGASQVQRGDIVVFKTHFGGATDYVKRVIGLPGERVQLRESRLYIGD